MRIIGIDPGTARIGWAVIESDASSLKPIAYGLIETTKTDTDEKRLKVLYDALNSLITKYTPDIMSVEDLYFATNAKTAISVGQARGIVLLSAANKSIPTVSFSPLAVKRIITGDGHADKKQVERMIMLTLKLKNPPKPDDTTDAIAIALSLAYTKKFKYAITKKL